MNECGCGDQRVDIGSGNWHLKLRTSKSYLRVHVEDASLKRRQDMFPEPYAEEVALDRVSPLHE
jgi:hypothetical protein